MQLSDVEQRALMPAGASSSDLRQIQEEATPLHSPSNSPRAHPATMASTQVPAFSPGQITAAQVEQQKSMVAYSMLVRVLNFLELSFACVKTCNSDS